MLKTDKPLHVAVGVIRDLDGNILLSQRARHAHQGGLWEFPGGKLEPGETAAQALQRELLEEVGIRVTASAPLIKIRHDYGDKQVLLDVWNVTAFEGQAQSCENQLIRWIKPEQLGEFNFPAANLPIITAAQLPPFYAILEGDSVDLLHDRCQQILNTGIKLLQFRAKSLVRADLMPAYEAISAACSRHNATLMVNADLGIGVEHNQGLHLSSRALLACDKRPVDLKWLAASCHNLKELTHAEKLGVDFAVLAPIKPTATHPNAIPLGWEQLNELLEKVNIPTYALGGLEGDDLQQAQACGAQGIAGISCFLSK